MNAPFKRPFARKPIFDTVRELLGRPFRQAEVDGLDDTIDAALSGKDLLSLDSVPTVPNMVKRKRDIRTIGAEGIALIKRFEGCARLRKDGLIEAYPDPGTGNHPWTIGWGATGKGIGPGTVWTQGECDARLTRDLIRYASDVARALNGAPTSQPQFDALVSFHYNTGAIGRATLTKKHKVGDFSGALAEFHRWNRAGGRVLKGLSRRRADEAKLYAKG
jgi:GH24 family phage-related lysozyme (muramidase)